MRGIADLDTRRRTWRERRVREWIASLPLAEPARALSLLARSVRALNASPMDPSTRIALLCCYEEPARNLAAALQGPRGDGQRVLLAALHSEIAQGYQTALASADVSREGRRCATRGALRQLTEVMLAAFRAYVPTPPGLWRRIHALFRNDELLGEEVEQAYVQALLLGLSDPYALPVGGIDVVHQVVALLAPAAVLNPTQGFAIAFEADRVVEARGAAALYLDTAPVLADLARWRKDLKVHRRLPEALAPFVLPALAERLFGLLQRSWYSGPRRRLPRVRLGGERLVCHDLATLRRCAGLGSGQQFVDLDRPFNPGLAAAVRLSTWRVRDAGRGGLWLSTHELSGAPPLPGAWIGIKDPHGDGEWRIGSVRWLKRARPHEYAIGVQILGDMQARAVLRAGFPTATRPPRLWPAAAAGVGGRLVRTGDA